MIEKFFRQELKKHAKSGASFDDDKAAFVNTKDLINDFRETCQIT